MTLPKADLPIGGHCRHSVITKTEQLPTLTCEKAHRK